MVCGRAMLEMEAVCGRTRLATDAVFGCTLEEPDVSSESFLLDSYNVFCRVFEGTASKGRDSAFGRIVVVVPDGTASDRRFDVE